MAAAIFLTGCNKPSSAPGAGSGSIKVGEFASLTGKEATFGQSPRMKAPSLAPMEDLNAAGGVLGRQKNSTSSLKTISPRPANPPRSLTNSSRATMSWPSWAEVYLSRSLEAAPICQDNKIPMISPSSTNPKVTETGDYIFRVCFIDPFQGKVMANFAYEHPEGPKKSPCSRMSKA